MGEGDVEDTTHAWVTSGDGFRLIIGIVGLQVGAVGRHLFLPDLVNHPCCRVTHSIRRLASFDNRAVH